MKALGGLEPLNAIQPIRGTFFGRWVCAGCAKDNIKVATTKSKIFPLIALPFQTKKMPDRRRAGRTNEKKIRLPDRARQVLFRLSYSTVRRTCQFRFPLKGLAINSSPSVEVRPFRPTKRFIVPSQRRERKIPRVPKSRHPARHKSYVLLGEYARKAEI